MKKLLFTLTALLISISPIMADTNVKAGPRKGLILELPGKNAEFFVEKDRTVSIALYDADMKNLQPTEEVITATAEAPSGKTKLEFEKKGNFLVSTKSLPEGEGYQIVLQAKSTSEAKSKNFRIKLETHTCGSCGNPEYACTCDE